MTHAESGRLHEAVRFRGAAYRPDIDGLRAVAVLSVVLHHLSASLVPGGYVGVDVFFVISGYLITSIISREMAEGCFSFRKFYERRARRIFPALFTVLAVTLIASHIVLLPSDYAATLRAALGTVFFSSNLVFWQVKTGYFNPETRLNPLLHTWSLGVEEQFYLLFPIFLLVCYRFLRKHLFMTLLVCAAVSLAGAEWLVRGNNEAAAFYLSPFRAWELLAGSLLAFDAMPRIRSRTVRELLAAGGLMAILAACLVYSDSTTFPGLTALVPALGAVAIIHAGASGATLAGRLLQWRPMVYIGLISYSLYLWHWPLIVLAQYANGLDMPQPYLLLAMSVLLASISYHFVEQPVRRARGMPSWALPSTAGFVLVVSIFCVAGLVNDGFEGRFDSKVVKLDQSRSPPIPYAHCSDLFPEATCVLGHPEGEPDILLWGDSHVVAWAPALHASLLQARRKAVLAAFAACPPLFDMDNALKSSCAEQNAAVKKHLIENPKIKTVVLMGFWSTYFREEGPIKVAGEDGETTIGGVAAAQQALDTTRRWLEENGRTVILIGPVPVYDKNVPAALAVEAVTDRATLDLSAGEQRRKHAPFHAVVAGVQPSASFRFLDPIRWLCAQKCAVIKDGVTLYRDANHLSVEGAMLLAGNLSEGLALSPGGSR